MNQAKARSASIFHLMFLVAVQAATQAEIVAAASSGCWSNGSGGWRKAPKECEPTGRNTPEGAVCMPISQLSVPRPVRTREPCRVASPVAISACGSRALS